MGWGDRARVSEAAKGKDGAGRGSADRQARGEREGKSGGSGTAVERKTGEDHGEDILGETGEAVRDEAA